MRALLTWTVGLGIAAFTLGPAGPAQGTEDPFLAMGVQRPANPAPAPNFALPALDDGTFHLKKLRGKVVLLGFFTTT